MSSHFTKLFVAANIFYNTAVFASNFETNTRVAPPTMNNALATIQIGGQICNLLSRGQIEEAQNMFCHSYKMLRQIHDLANLSNLVTIVSKDLNQNICKLCSTGREEEAQHLVLELYQKLLLLGRHADAKLFVFNLSCSLGKHIRNLWFDGSVEEAQTLFLRFYQNFRSLDNRDNHRIMTSGVSNQLGTNIGSLWSNGRAEDVQYLDLSSHEKLCCWFFSNAETLLNQKLKEQPRSRKRSRTLRLKN